MRFNITVLRCVTLLCYFIIIKWVRIMAKKIQHDSETRKELLKCAKEEFMDKGFMGASLRNICQKAGVTTGALYFFFKDKDDLFCNVVGHMMDRLNAVLTEHFSVEVDEMNNGMASDHNEDSDFESARNIVHEIYMHREEVLLVLTKSQGSSMESMPDNIVDQMDAHNAFICEAMCRAYGTPMVDRNVVQGNQNPVMSYYRSSELQGRPKKRPKP